MRVMGIDPGLTRTGYGVVERRAGRLVAVGYGTVRAPAGASLGEQLHALRGALATIIERYEPAVAAMERLFFNANRQTALRAAQASGVGVLAVAEAGLELYEYTPSQVKLGVCGNGSAGKKQVETMVSTILKLTERPDSADAADALAVAICHSHGHGVRSAARAAGAAR